MIRVVRVISLDRTPQRFDVFLAANPGLPIMRVPAVDGARLQRAACVRDGVITEDNLYRMGAIGNALSHVALWRECAAGSVPFHVVEDDIVLRTDFRATAARLLRALSAWDIVLWAHNLDWPVMVAPPGLGSLVLQYSPEEAAEKLHLFPAAAGPAVLLPLVSAASTACYSLSPAGAARALAECLPCTAIPARYAVRPEQGWRNTALDVEMSRHYANWASYIAVPPLGLAPNDQQNSTVRGHLAQLHDPMATCRAPL